MRVVIDRVSKRFGGAIALHQVELEIRSQELFFLLGPSGCGKTTLLRVLAGFYQPDSGEIFFGDRRVTKVPPHRRNTGLVFQNYALWPHMSVADNVAYGLEVRSLSKPEVQQRVQEVLEIVQMERFQDRLPNQLSGGQQQRVALARALVIRPDVLLLDEPLSNLDTKLRLEMREEIRRIHRHARITTIYVTHDQKEALSLADRIAVLNHGRVEQVDEPRAIYRQPVNRFVAEFLGETNWLDGTIAESSSTALVVQTPVGTLSAPPNARLASGMQVWVGFRPESVELGGGPGAFAGRVQQTMYLGEVEQFRFEAAASLTFKGVRQNPKQILNNGEPLSVRIDPENLFVLEATRTGAESYARAG